VLRRVKEVTEALRDDPRPTGVIKVKNADEWRRRVGDYRITFTVDDSSFAICDEQARTAQRTPDR
jgi:mRNA-degrading endonuclease RelE of RelBE toxin-antitoxin system